jgi:hypothetical protein
MRTKEHGSQTVTIDDSGILWAYRLVRTKHHLKNAGGHKHSPIGSGYLRISASPDTNFIMVGNTPSLHATTVSCLGSVTTASSVVLLASGSWTPTRFGLRSSTRNVPTPMIPLAPTFVEDYSEPLTRPNAAQHADPLPKHVLCAHRVAAIDPASAASLLSMPVVAPTELPWSPPICTCFATYSPCTSPAVDPPPAPTADPPLPPTEPS